MAWRNPRRYGGYTVHLGVVLLCVGFAGAAFNREVTVETAPGSAFSLGNYELQIREFREGAAQSCLWSRALVEVRLRGRLAAVLEPERRFYPSIRQAVSEVAIRRGLSEDLYLNFAGFAADGVKAVMQAHVFPLVSWIWIGFGVILAGGVICLLPGGHSRLRPAAAELPTGVGEAQP